MTERDKVLEIIRLKNQQPVEVERRKTALLVIDVQRYFVSPDYPFAQVFERLERGATGGYFERVKSAVVPNVRRLLKCCRTEGLPVIYTATGTRTGDGGDLPRWLQEFDQLGLFLLGRRIWPHAGDPAWQIDEGVAPLPGEPVLNKTASGPFNSTELGQILDGKGINTLLIAGLTTDVCVTQAAREAADRGFRVVIAEDACTTLSEEMHRSALRSFSLAFGQVRKTREVVKFLATPVLSA